MEQITLRLRKRGEFYELDGELIRRTVGRGCTEHNPFDILWTLRESARELTGDQLPDDTYPDERIRRTVGKVRTR